MHRWNWGKYEQQGWLEGGSVLVWESPGQLEVAVDSLCPNRLKTHQTPRSLDNMYNQYMNPKTVSGKLYWKKLRTATANKR